MNEDPVCLQLLAEKQLLTDIAIRFSNDIQSPHALSMALLETLGSVTGSSLLFIAGFNPDAGSFHLLESLVKNEEGSSQTDHLKSEHRLAEPADLVNRFSTLPDFEIIRNVSLVQASFGLLTKEETRHLNPSKRQQPFGRICFRSDNRPFGFALFGFDEKGPAIPQSVLAVWMHLALQAIRRYQKEAQLVEQEVRFRKTFDQLTETRDQLEMILHNVHDGINVIDGKAKLVYVNMEAARMAGFASPDDMMQHFRFSRISSDFKVYDETGHPIPAERIPSRVALTGEFPAPALIRYRLPDSNDDRWALVKSVPIFNAEKEVSFVVTTTHDFTIQRRYEESLKLKDFAIQSSLNAFGLADMDGRLIYVNNACLMMWGYSGQEAMIGLNLTDLYESKEKVATVLTSLRTTGQARGEGTARRCDGSTFAIEYLANIVKDTNGEPIFMMASLVDISQRKNIEKQLHQSIDNLQAAERIARLGHYEIDLRTGSARWSEEVFDIFGLNPSEGEPTVEEYTNLIHPNDQAALFDMYNRSITQGAEFNLIYRIKHADGSFRYVHSISHVKKDADGAPRTLFGTLQDITESRKVAETLTLKNAAFDASLAANVILSADGLVEEINESFRQLWGLSTKERVVGHPFNICITNPDEYAGIMQVLNQKGKWSGDFIAKKFDGTPFPVLAMFTKIHDQEGNLAAYQASFIDITQRLRAEEELRRSEEKYREIFQGASEGIFQTTFEGVHLSVNPAFALMLGYDSPESLIRSVKDIGSELYVDQEARKRLVVLLHEHGSVSNYETQVRKKDGSVIWISINAHVVYDQFRDAGYLEGTCIEITERKNAEEKLKIMAEMLDLAPGAINVIDLAGKVLYANRRTAEYHGMNQQEYLSTSIVDVALPETANAIGPRMAEVMKHGEYSFEVSHYRKDGSVVEMEIFTKLVTWGGTPAILSVGTDITERKKTFKALRQSEEKYRLLAENSADLIWTLNTEGKFTYISPSIEKLRGYKPEEVMKQSLEAVIQPSYHGIINDYFSDAIARIAHGQREFNVPPIILEQPHKDGSVVWTESLVQPIFDEKNQHTGFLGVTRNITDRITAERMMHETEKRFRALIENAPDGIVLINTAGAFKYVSPAGRKMFYYELEDEIGDHPNDLTHPEDLPMVLQTLEQIIANPSLTPVIQYRFRAKDGSYKWIESTFTNLFNDPAIEAIVINFRDITARKNAEIALIQSEARLTAFMNYVPAMILLKDHEFRTFFANENLQRLFPVENWFGRKPHEIYHEDLANLIYAQDRMAMEQGYVSYEEVRNDRQGNPGIYFTQKFRIDVPGADPLLGAIITNITEQKKNEEHIRELNTSLERRVQERTTELQEANKELEAFAYTVSHDLRAPVRAIGGFTRILMDDYSVKLDSEGQRICRVITDNTHRMEHLIDDLLSFSRLSRVDMNLSTIDMAEVVWKCFDEQALAGDRQRIILKVSELPFAKGDYPMLVQVWSNLLSNAIKYTSHREIAEITVGSYREGPNFVYYIRDNGTGFDMKYSNKLFGVFQRLHSAKEYEGTGVGLAIVHRIIQRHGGKIWAEGEVDSGATFSFTLNS